MHDLKWLNDTVYWKRGENLEPNDFTIVDGYDYFLGMLDPQRNVEYGFDKKTMKDLVKHLSDSFDYKQKNLWENKGVKRTGKEDKDEMHYLVHSYQEDKDYQITLKTIPYEWNDMNTRLMALKNLDFIDHCPKGSYRGRICSMPKEACIEWGIKEDDWRERTFDKSKPKIYGYLADMHVVQVLKSLDLFPVFDERKFQALIPKAVNIIKETPKRKENGKKWYAEDLGKALRPVMDEMALPELSRWFRFSQIENMFKDKFYRKSDSFPNI